VNPFSKLLLIPAVVVAIGTGVGIAAATNGASNDDPVAGVTSVAGTTSAADVKGPCDEAEHAGDPRCLGVQVPEDDHGATTTEDLGDDNGNDANDPGEVEDQNDDHGQIDDDQGENAQDDNSGPSASSGHGSSHDNGDDDSDEDGNSGHGGGDEGGDD
jgi:hypothetical protein